MENIFSKEIEYMAVLKSIPMFKEFNIEMLYKILKTSKYKKITKGEIIIKRGEYGKKIYVVLEGELGVYLEERQTFVAKIKNKEVIGDIAVINKEKHTATIKTITDSLLLELDREEFIDLLKRNGTISFAIIKNFSRRLRNMVNK